MLRIRGVAMIPVSECLAQGCASIRRGEADVLWISDTSGGYVGITVEATDGRTVWCVETDHEDRMYGEGDELPTVDGPRVELVLRHPSLPVRKRLILESKDVARVFLKREGENGFEVTLWEATV